MKSLQLFSYHINEQNIDNCIIYRYTINERLYGVLEQLNNSKGKRMAGTSFNKIVCVNFPSIIYCHNKIWDIINDNMTWFYSTEPLDLELLMAKLIKWIEKENIRINRTRIDLNYEKDRVYEKNSSLKEIIASPIGYRIVPYYYLNILTMQNMNLECLHIPLKFFRVVGDNTPCIMTHPIWDGINNFTSFFYSISCMLENSIENIGYLLNFKLHIKIWEEAALIKGKINYLTNSESSSLYICSPNAYNDVEVDSVFTKISINRDNSTQFVYKTIADKIFSDACGVDMLSVLKSKGVNKEENKNIVLISKKKNWSSKTKKGGGLPERYEIQIIIGKLLNKLELRSPLNFIGKPVISKSSRIRDIKCELSDLAINMNDGININKNVNKYPLVENKNYNGYLIIIASNNNKFYDIVTQYFRIILRLLIKDVNIFYSKQGTNFEFKYIPNNFTRSISKETSLIEREKEISCFFGESEDKILKLALIDSPNYQVRGLSNGERDPKSIIREVCRRNRTLTQFIEYSEYDRTGMIDIILNAIKDLIAAGGFIEAGIIEHEDAVLLGVCKISSSSHDIIVGMSKIDNSGMYINLFGMDKWLTLQDYIFNINPTMVIKIIANMKDKERAVTKNDLNSWILSNLSGVVEQTNGIVYAFIDSNLRAKGLWSYASNAQFNNYDKCSISSKCKLRMVRINNEKDVPDYCINSNGNNINKESGVFKGANHTYYLIGKRNDSDRANLNWTKMDAPDKILKRPGILEVNIQGAISEEEEEYIALYTQRLRSKSITYDGHTSVPFPLFCMQRLTEYLATFLK